jgi:hypothetical protein
MKHLLLILSLIFAPFLSSGQSRIGYTEYQIREDFSTETFYYGYTDEKIKYIYFNDERILSMYFFNKDGICVLCSASPLNVGTLNYMVELYNKQYVIIDDKNWKSYTKNGGIIYISLVEVNGVLTFMYSTK